MAKRRAGLIAAVARAAREAEAAEKAKKPAQDTVVGLGARRHAANAFEETTTSRISMPTSMLELLRLVAVKRAAAEGGRPSVSNVVRGLVQQHWDELKREAEDPAEQST
jgi:acyl-CoA-binding protein